MISKLFVVSVAVALVFPAAAQAQDDARTKQLRLLCARLSGDFASPSGIIAFRRCLNQNPLSAMRRNVFGARAGDGAAGKPAPPPQPPKGFGRDSRIELASAVSRFQAVAGFLYVQTTDGKLWRQTAGTKDGKVVLDSVTSFRAVDGTTFYARDPLGRLWRVSGTNAGQQVETDVAAFQPLDAESLVVLGQDGRLWRIRGSDKTQLDREVTSFQAIDATTTYIKNRDGKLWRWNGSEQSLISSDAADFRIEGENAFVLTTGGELWRKHGEDKPVKVSGNVRAFQPAGPRWVYVQIKAGSLWLGEGPDKPHAFVDSDLLDETGAPPFQAIDAEHVYVLGADRKLWAETMPVLAP